MDEKPNLPLNGTEPNKIRRPENKIRNLQPRRSVLTCNTPTAAFPRRSEKISSQRIQEKRARNTVKRKEYQRLRYMVPSIAAKPNVSKVTVIEEAIRYIDELHSALLTRLRTKGLPKCLKDVDIDVEHSDESEIREVVRQWIANNQDFIDATSSNSDKRPELSSVIPVREGHYLSTSHRTNNVTETIGEPSRCIERTRQQPSYLQRISNTKHC